VLPTPPPDDNGFPSRSIVCTDGDPSCDADGAVDGGCTFKMAACMNNVDPRFAPGDGPGCSSPGLVALSSSLPAMLGDLGKSLPSTLETCSAPESLRVLLRKAGKGKKKKGVVKMKAAATSMPNAKGKRLVDKDALSFTCLPPGN